MIVAVDTETTGLVPFYNEVIQLAIVPMTPRFDIDKTINPFMVYIRPNKPENWSEDARKVNGISDERIKKEGFASAKAGELLEEWAGRFKTKLQPVAQNWPFDRPFLIDLLGYHTFDNLFDYHFRDNASVAQYINDKNYFLNGKILFPSVSLKNLAKSLGVEVSRSHDALHDCITTAKVYQKLVEKLPGL